MKGFQMHQDEITFRKFEDNDIDGIVKLLNKVFNNKFSKEWWEWKYFLNPNGFHGKEGDIWIAEHDGKIIGHYAVIPEKMKVNNDIINVAQSVDTATDPDYRGKGIFTKLANKVYHDAKIRYDFIFGFPSEMASRGFIKLGWINLHTISVYIKILDYSEFLKEELNNRFLGTISGYLLKSIALFNGLLPIDLKGKESKIEEIVKFDEKIDVFLNKSFIEKKIMVYRDIDNLNWKYGHFPNNFKLYVATSNVKDEILGYLTIKILHDHIIIMDILSVDDEELTYSKLLNKAIEIGKKERKKYIILWSTNWDQKMKIISHNGFMSLNTFKKQFNKYMMPIIIYNLNNYDVESLNKWSYSYSDSDHSFIIE